MNQVVLPSAPNWYQSSNLACANDGTIAWISKNAIVVSKRIENSKIPDYIFLDNAHLDKINTIDFSPEYGKPEKNLLVSGGAEPILRIWDLNKRAAVASQSYSDANQKVIDVSWSKADPSLICSISVDGVLLSWNLTYNCSQSFSLGKVTATCISCCPHKQNLAVVGSKCGLLFIVNLQGSGTVNHKIRADNTEIVSLSWCPTDVNIFKENSSKKDCLLACGARNKTISIWRAGGDGRSEFQVLLPNNPLHSEQHRSKQSQKAASFTAVCWIEPKLLLANSNFGEILAIDLPPAMKKPNWRVVHCRHARGIFSIKTVPCSNPIETDKENWRVSVTHQVWTIALDRKVIGCSVINSSCEIDACIYTHSGNIYCVAACPLDTSLIAFGSGDQVLRVWNLSEPHESSFDIKIYWQHIKGKVTAISWHPEQENLLAFGTGEGRVGVFDTNNKGKPPVIYSYYHRKTVYTIGWGPSPSKTGHDLYSCGDSELIQYNSSKPKDPPNVLKKNCTEFAWNPSFTCMAMGFENGSISFLNSKLEVCKKPIFLLKKAIQRFAWHPDSTATDLNLSPMKNYLAVAINGNDITIFDMTTLIEHHLVQPNNVEIPSENGSEGNEQADEPGFYKVVGTLKGHADRINCLAWNPHVTGQLVSGGYDNTAQVWKVETMEIMASFTGHFGPIYSCMWSPLNPDYIMTGSADLTLRVWKVSDQKVFIPPQKTEIKKAKLKKKKTAKSNAEKSPAENGTTEVSEADSTVNNAINNENKNGLNGNVEEPTVKEEMVVKEILTKEKRHKSKKAGYLSVYKKKMTNKEIFTKSCLKIAKCVKNNNEPDDSDDNNIATIFGTKQEVMSIVNAEQDYLKNQSHFTIATEMSLWTNNLRQQLQEAAQEKRLNDYVVSLAPMLSVKTWQEMCDAYANQLILESNIPKAVHYFLCIHKIYRAIEVMCDAKIYREAYVLAKCKLDSNDPTLSNILADWAAYAMKCGSFDEAAQCYTALGEYSKAACYLAKKKDVLYLETAAEIARFNNTELSESLADETFNECLLENNFDKAESIIFKFPEILHRLLHLIAMKEIERFRCRLISVESWLKKEVEFDLVVNLKNHFDELTLDCNAAYAKLNSINYPIIPGNRATMWLMVSHQIALAAAAPSEDKKMHHIVSALAKTSQYEFQHPVKSEEPHVSNLISLLTVLTPKLEFHCSEENTSETDSLKLIYKSFRSYVCLGLINWLFERLSKQEHEKINFDINQVVDLIESFLPECLNSDAIKFWTTSGEIRRLEESLLVAMSNGNVTKKENETENIDEEETKNEEIDSKELVEKLEQVRAEKKKFIDERVSVPAPILIYSKVNELCNVLPDQDVQIRFNQLVKDLWTTITS